MKSFSIGEVLRSSWAVFKKQWLQLLIVFIVVGVASFLPSFVAQIFVKSAPLVSILISIVSWVLSIVVALGMIKVILDVSDGKDADVPQLFYVTKKLSLVWQYVITSLVPGIVIVILSLPLVLIGVLAYALKIGNNPAAGMLMLILTVLLVGFVIYVSVRLQFWMYVFVDRGIWGAEAIKESWRMTKGRVLNLILFSIVLVLLNFVGAILFVVGLLVTIPVSMIAMAMVYRRLSGQIVVADAAVEAKS